MTLTDSDATIAIYCQATRKALTGTAYTTCVTSTFRTEPSGKILLFSSFTYSGWKRHAVGTRYQASRDMQKQYERCSGGVPGIERSSWSIGTCHGLQIMPLAQVVSCLII